MSLARPVYEAIAISEANTTAGETPHGSPCGHHSQNCYGNRSERSADCQAVLMNVFRTLKQRGHDKIAAIYNALGTYLNTGKLPPLPAASL